MAYNGYYGNFNSATPTHDYQPSNYGSYDHQRSHSGQSASYQPTSLPSMVPQASAYQGYPAQESSNAWYGSSTATANASHGSAAEALSRLGDYNSFRPSAQTAHTSNTSTTPVNPAPGNVTYTSRVNVPQTSSNLVGGGSTHVLPQSDGSASQTQNLSYTAHQQRPKSVNSESSRQSPMRETSNLPRSNFIYSSSPAAQNQAARTRPGSRQGFRSNSPYHNTSTQPRGHAQTGTAAPPTGSRRDQHQMANDGVAATYASSASSRDLQSHGSRQPSAYSTHRLQSNVSRTYDGVADQTDPVTVDPSQVYDPWPEYQRKRALEQAEERRTEARRAEEARQAEQIREADEARKIEEARRADELRQAEKTRDAQKQTNGHPTSKVNPSVDTTANSVQADSNPPAVGNGGDLEAQMKAMFLKMREFHDKDPQLLAKIWEQERTSHQESAQSPARTTANSPPKERKAAKIQSQSSVSTGSVQPNTSKPLVNNDSTNMTHREPSMARKQGPPKSISSQQRQQLSTPNRQVPPQKPSKAQKTGTIWPSEKKTQLAEAAAIWLNAIPANDEKANASQIRAMLDNNPSYIELCEELESSGLKVDRAAFARALLTAVPEMNSAPRQQVQRPAQPPSAPQTIRPSNLSKKSDTSEPSKSQPKSSVLDSKTQNLSQMAANTHTPPVTSAPNTKPRAPVSHMLSGRQASVSGLPQRMQPPASKEEAARKRSFAEIVDLTEQLSDEDLAPEEIKHQRVAGHSMPLSADQPPSTDSSKLETGLATQTGVQPPQTGKSKQVEEYATLYSDSNIVHSLDKRKALRRSTYNPKTIARDVLLATGRHPEMRPLNAHLDILTSKFKAMNASADLGTFRWDLVDPGQPIISHSTPAIDHGAEADNEDDAEPGSQRARAQITIFRQIVDPTTGAVSTVEERISAPGSSSRTKKLGRIKKRRGRPARESGTGVVSRPYGYGEGQSPQAPAQQDRTQAVRQESNTRQPVGSTSMVQGGTASSSSTHTGYAALRQQLAADGTPLPKKRGRPVGWRKHIHGLDTTRSGVNADTAASNSRQAQSRSDPPEPKYPVFKCKWKGCSGKLHNLETLRKHIKMLHGKPVDEKWECHWSGCESLDSMDATPDTIHHVFGSQEAWMQHVEKQHLTPIAWELGDGPMGGLSDAHESDVSEAYLSDAQGRQVTPRVSMPPQDQDSPTTPHPAAPSSTEQGSKRRVRPPGSGHKTLRDQAIEAQNSLETKKRQIGPGLDRGGSILVNEKRKQGFVDDEGDDARIVDDDEI